MAGKKEPEFDPNAPLDEDPQFDPNAPLDGEDEPQFDPSVPLDDGTLVGDIDAMAKGQPVRPEEYPHPLETALDFVSRPINAISTGAVELYEHPGDPKRALDRGLEQFKPLGEKHPSRRMSDIMKDLLPDVTRGAVSREGMPNKVAAGVMGAGTEAVLDPVGYGLGAAGKIPAAARAIKGSKALQGMGEAINYGAHEVETAAKAKTPGFIDRAISVLGPKAETVMQYRQDPSRAQGEPALEAVQSQIDEVMEKMRRGVLSKKAAVTEARRLADEAHDLAMQGFQQVMPPTELEPRVLDALTRLKAERDAKSLEAFDIASNKGISIPRAEVENSFIELVMPRLHDKITPEGNSVLKRYDQIYDNITKLPDEVDGERLKNIIKELDEVTDYATRNGQTLGSENAFKQQLRRYFDAHLKDDEEYKAVMKQVSDDTRLLEPAQKAFGDPANIKTRLAGIHKDNASYYADMLKKLGGRMGDDFGSVIDEYRGAQSYLGPGATGNREAFRRSLPEWGAYTSAETDLASADDVYKRYSQHLGGDKTIAAIRKAMGRRQPDQMEGESTAMLKRLDEFYTKDNPIMKQLENEQIKAAFNKGYPQGSANVNMFANAGAAAGEAVGIPPKFTRAAGGLVGRAVDRAGGNMARWMADTSVWTFGKAQKIPALAGKMLTGPGAMFKYPAISTAIGRAIQDASMSGQSQVMISDPRAMRDLLGLVQSSTDITSEERAQLFTEIQDNGGLLISIPEPPPQAAPPPPSAPVDPVGTLKGLLGNVLGG